MCIVREISGFGCLKLILSLLALLSAPAFAEITPYLQTPTANSIWVSWKTASGNESVVEYGLASDALNQTASGNTQSLASDYQYHSVQLAGLEPDTLYYYRTRSGAETSAVHRFKTQPVDGDGSGHFRILVLGDHQIRAEDRYLKLVTAAKRKIEQLYGTSVEESINLILNDGDQVDVGTLDHYENIHFAQSAPLSPNLPIMTTVGNHEYYSDGNLDNYRAHFIYDGTSYQGIAPASDESYYAYQSGRVLFIHLNSMRTDAVQQQWLTQVIDAADQDTSVDWVISIIHHPYQAEQYVGDISATFRNQWMGILSASPKHVLNIGGHHHLYARGQTREWPTYHMISGGTAWDQYWGQSTETDFDDVQKTIANWAWQIIDIDVANRSMTVESYAEAHPIIYKNNGGIMHYNSRLIDRFERQLDGVIPDTPEISNTISAAVTLPYTFRSSPFSSPGGRQLNSTQFQIATDIDFSNLVVDRIRDYENIYGDTGAPHYEPVDIHAGVDIMQWEVPAFGLNNGEHYIRVRHRDRNVEWSQWSDARAFTVEGSTDGPPATNLDKSRYQSGEDVTVTYVNGYGNARDWLAVYRKGQTPGSASSNAWTYVPEPSGVHSFSGLADGEYFVAFMENDTHTEIAPRAYFYVGPVTNLSTDKTRYAEGESVDFTYSNAPGGGTDWIGVYRIGDVPGDVNSTKWDYTPATSGSLTISGFGKGYYFAAFFVNDGYTEVSDRVYFGVGDEIVQIALTKSQYDVGEPIEIAFSNGRGGLKDYIGIFRKIPGILPDGDNLLGYAYFDGALSGSVTISKTFTGDDIPAGEYVVGMYENDGYDRISNEVCILVGIDSGCDLSPELSADKSSYLVGETITFNWTNVAGNSNDWIGIYKAGDTPGPVPAVKWAYISGSSGSIGFGDLSAGSYFAVVLLNDGYSEGTARVAFTVNQPPVLAIDSMSVTLGETVNLSWSNTPGGARDWIGIYRKGDTPGPVASAQWSYISGASGTISFSGLAEGSYFAVVLLNNGYEEATGRVNFSVEAPPPVAGDLNGDRLVDAADRKLLRASMGQCSADAAYNSAADYNADGCVNMRDYRLWLRIYRRQ